MSAKKIEKVSGRLSRTYADFCGHFSARRKTRYCKFAKVRGNLRMSTDVRRHLRTICCGRSWTVTTDFSRGHSRTFSDYSPRTIADCLRGHPRTFPVDIRGQLRTIVRGLSQTFPWTFADHSPPTFADLLPRTFAYFPRGHSHTFAHFLLTFADIIRLL